MSHPMRLRRLVSGLATLTVLGLTACGESLTPPADDAVLETAAFSTVGGMMTPVIGDIIVCKHGSGGNFDVQFDVDVVHPDLPVTRVFILTGECQLVYRTVLDDGLAKDQRVLVTEVPPVNAQFDSIVVVKMDSDGRIIKTVLTDLTSLLVAKPGATGVVATYYNHPTNGGNGCTPGAWKNRLYKIGAWAATGYSPTQTVKSVFSAAGSAPYTHLGNATLLGSLSFQGGSTVAQKAEILLRAGTAALLNAAHPGVAYPKTAAQVIAAVNAALASQDPVQILTLATELDTDNNLGCSL